MKKVIRLGTLEDGARKVDVFCKIEITDGKLSITGVEGPKSNGDAWGGCGQIVMSLKAEDIRPAPGWSREKVALFLQTWDKWHLNDMRANCKHQVGPEWEPKDVTLYHFRLTDEASEMQRKAKEAALSSLKTGAPFTPTAEQQLFAALEYALAHHEPNPPAKLGLYYRPKTPLYPSDSGATETKKTNWLQPDEHPEGYLCKPCPVCGYKYGSQWLREELPAEVVTFLESLPDTDKTPAWV